jgi:hypothetical protein
MSRSKEERIDLIMVLCTSPAEGRTKRDLVEAVGKGKQKYR